MNVRPILFELTKQALADQSYTSPQGLMVLPDKLADTRHTVRFLKPDMPLVALDEASGQTFATFSHRPSDSLLEVLEQEADTGEKVAVLLSLDPFYPAGGQFAPTSNQPESLLARHSTLMYALKDDFFRDKFYNLNHHRRNQQRSWNDLKGSLVVSYIHHLHLIARSERHIYDSQLPITEANEQRLAKELYIAPKAFHAIVYNSPVAPKRFSWHTLNAQAQALGSSMLYHKLRLALSLAKQNHVHTLIVPAVNGVPVSVFAPAFKKALLSLFGDLKKVVFLQGQDLEAHFPSQE